MAEITRVPLQPIRKGSLSKLWLGIAVLVLLAAAIAWAAAPHAAKLEGGVTLTTLVEGKGVNPGSSDFVLINYTGKLPDGTVFDKGEICADAGQSRRSGFFDRAAGNADGRQVPGLHPGCPGLRRRKAAARIPPNSDLTFDVELVEHAHRSRSHADDAATADDATAADDAATAARRRARCSGCARGTHAAIELRCL